MLMTIGREGLRNKDSYGYNDFPLKKHGVC